MRRQTTTTPSGVTLPVSQKTQIALHFIFYAIGSAPPLNSVLSQQDATEYQSQGTDQATVLSPPEGLARTALSVPNGPLPESAIWRSAFHPNIARRLGKPVRDRDLACRSALRAASAGAVATIFPHFSNNRPIFLLQFQTRRLKRTHGCPPTNPEYLDFACRSFGM